MTLIDLLKLTEFNTFNCNVSEVQ